MSSSEKICARVRASFSEFLEEDLAAEERREVEAHLAECAGCAESFARFREAIAVLGQLSRPEPPADLPDRIDRALDRLEPVSLPRARPAGRRRLVQHAVAAMLVGGIIVGIIRVVPEVGGPLPARQAASPESREALPAAKDEFAAMDRAIGPAAGALMGETAPAPAPTARSESAPAIEEKAAKAAPAYRENAEVARARDDDKRVAASTVTPHAAREMLKQAAPAAPAAKKPDVEEPSYYAPRDGEPGGARYARGLLLAARNHASWITAVRDLALSHPGDLASAWAGLDAETRKGILAVWSRAAPVPNLAADLARAGKEAGSPAEQAVIQIFADAIHPPAP
ncbi:MAG: zf-HC2 domain-containing protein [Deltaproteobacteria bacterium]|nr:zf-HC2 domain-containing protein [Deltaproteobacteria bacterium]